MWFPANASLSVSMREGVHLFEFPKKSLCMLYDAAAYDGG